MRHNRYPVSFLKCDDETNMHPRLSIQTILLLLATSIASAEDWPQWMGANRDGVWRETGIVRDFSAGDPETTWRAAVAGGFSGPAVAAGRVYLTDYVRLEGDASPDPDKRNELKGIERVLCLDEQTGEELWKHTYPRTYNISYPAGPRATPLVEGNRVYTLGAEGDLKCLNASNGNVVWSKNLPEEYNTKSPVWGYSAHPLIIGDKLICLAGGEGSAAVALDKETGDEIWRALTTPDIGYAPPTLIEAGGTEQLLIWHSRSLNSLDPETGELYWSEPLEPDYNMSIAPPQKSAHWLYVGAIKNKSMVVRLHDSKPSAQLVWKGTNKLGVGPSHCPVVLDPSNADYIYGVDRGGIRCVRLDTGEHVWQNFDLMPNRRIANAGTIFITRNQDRFFLLSDTGELAIAKLSPLGYEELGRTGPLVKPTHSGLGREVLWSAPAFANGAIFVRNDEELIRVSLVQKKPAAAK